MPANKKIGNYFRVVRSAFHNIYLIMVVVMHENFVWNRPSINVIDNNYKAMTDCLKLYT